MRIATLLVVMLGAMLAGCQTVQPTNETAVAYNRAFAHARDEITLLNVLRASAREPLQFSTISSVQGAVRTGASLRVPFVNLIDGGPNVISPEVTLSARNPTVSITPLANREFIQGLSRPLSPGVIDDLLVQGWPLDVVLGLTIGGVLCPGGTAKLNFGDDPVRDRQFLEAFRTVKDFGFEGAAATPFAELRMTGREALAALREGAGERHRITTIRPAPAGQDGAVVELVTPGRPKIRGIDFRDVCATTEADPGHAPENALVAAEGRSGGVVMRSVFGIFHYLGRAHAAAMSTGECRGDEPDAGSAARLFDIMPVCHAGPVDGAHVVTKFNGDRFAILRSKAASDRTLETLSLLIYLVDLQTSETAVKSSIPFIAITQP